MQRVAWIARTKRSVRTARRGVSFLSPHKHPLPVLDHIRIMRRIQHLSVYLDRVAMGRIGWPVRPLVDGIPDIENVTEALVHGPYGKCVYESDNDVCDNQVCTTGLRQRPYPRRTTD
jgi:hypothetical protein